MKEKGVLGVAAKLVKYPARYERLINTLLGRTIVVQDTETAVKLLKRGLGTVVTSDGIVFHQSGQITGGQPQAAQAFILGYERDLETLPKDIEKVERSLAATQQEVDSIRERLGESETALAALVRESEGALGHRTSLQDSLGQRGQRLAQLRGEMRALMASQAGLREQARVAQEDAARLGRERPPRLRAWSGASPLGTRGAGRRAAPKPPEGCLRNDPSGPSMALSREVSTRA